MASIPEELTEHLTILLTDERFGEVGHPDSNAKQLQDAGFQPKKATFVPVLDADYSREETRKRYEEAVKSAVEQASVTIGQFGIGSDGHIAGILPHSSAATADGWFTIYDAPPFVRATLTFQALRHIDAAYAMAFGSSKREALLNLRDKNLPLGDQPSQILKEMAEAYVFNDQLEDSNERQSGK